jgi:hypothetical protein
MISQTADFVGIGNVDLLSRRSLNWVLGPVDAALAMACEASKDVNWIGVRSSHDIDNLSFAVPIVAEPVKLNNLVTR